MSARVRLNVMENPSFILFPPFPFLSAQRNFNRGELKIGGVYNLVQVRRSVTPVDDSARVISRTILQRRPAANYSAHGDNNPG